METKNKYDNGKIYKLWSLETNEIYVGSTVQPLHKRLYEHRSKARQTPCSRVIYQEMNSLGIDSFSIELIEDYPCKSLNELHRREGHWIRELRATLNKFVAGRTGKEYREENKDKIHTYRKSWVQSNTEKLNEYRNEYNELNKDNLRARAHEYRCNNLEEKKAI
jgi:group I intron endonuclease